MVTIEQTEELRKTYEGRLLPEQAVRTRVNRFILENLRDAFCAGDARLVFVGELPAWSVPIVFAYPSRVFGEVGEVIVQAVDGSIMGYTPPEEVLRNARRHLA